MLRKTLTTVAIALVTVVLLASAAFAGVSSGSGPLTQRADPLICC